MASRNLAAAKAPAILATLLLAAVASHLPVLLPTLDNLYGQAFFYLAAFDLILGLLVALSVSEVFPVIRIRAGLGFGFFGYLAYADIVSGVSDAGLQLAAISIYSLALFLATFILHYHFLMFIWFAGLAAKVAYIWLRYGEEFANLF
ncbi:MAG: hypothetical protein LR015_15415 [Verrucomicrobia bacterium]|nr:hypothetical protein [Verrucomicrobiota bacterium]